MSSLRRATPPPSPPRPHPPATWRPLRQPATPTPSVPPSSCTTRTGRNSPVSTAHQNTPKKGDLAIQGYDPVSYFDGTPSKGSETITSWFDGATYRFANEANRAKFAADPVAFAPAYGGWCAYAMVDGDKVDVDPKTYKISNGRLLLFYNGLLGNTLKRWNKADDGEQLTKADGNWERTTR